MVDLILVANTVYHRVVCIEIADSIDELAVVHLVEQFKNLFANRAIFCAISLGNQLTFHTLIPSIHLLCRLTGSHFCGQFPRIQTQLLHNPQIVTYQPFLKDLIFGACTVDNRAEIDFFTGYRAEIAVAEVGTGGQNTVEDRNTPGLSSDHMTSSAIRRRSGNACRVMRGLAMIPDAPVEVLSLE